MKDERLAYNEAVERIRTTEYPMLHNTVFLDHAGTAICPKSLMEAFTHDITSQLYGNPHSGSWSSQLSTSRIDSIRLRLLDFFGADPTQFDLVFVANTTAGVKLVVDAMRARSGGFSYAYHEACHTSVVGAREEARQSACLGSKEVEEWIAGHCPFDPNVSPSASVLFSYSAQSHMDGRRYPLDWSCRLRDSKDNHNTAQIFTLLDAASLASTSPINLGQTESAPDFTVLSLYKIFGFPDLGILIVRRAAEGVFESRKYFGGGTVDLVVCQKEQWHVPKTWSLHERLEDGTLPFHNIIAVDAAIDTHAKLFGSMSQISAHSSWLASRLSDGLHGLHYDNGAPVCVLYSPKQGMGHNAGPIVAFNIKTSLGSWLSLFEFEKLAVLKGFHVRTGGLCCPGGISSALGLESWELRRNFSAGFRCGTENDIVNGKPTGVIRASLGAMSTISDVDMFIDFIREFYRDQPDTTAPTNADAPSQKARLRVKSITIYPIKSCGGFEVRPGLSWQVQPEGFAWDREWCLVHLGTGQALSQKRYPKMALLRPTLDFEAGLLRISYCKSDGENEEEEEAAAEVSVPLSAEPTTKLESIPMASRVCGDKVMAQRYTSEAITTFFTTVLGVPCALARFPPGGKGNQARHSTAKLQTHQTQSAASPTQDQKTTILLSNESPILAIYSHSVRSLNERIRANGGKRVLDKTFRANIVVEPAGAPGEHVPEAYSEDTWQALTIGSHEFELLGACRRCQMVCVDQDSGAKTQEPLATLARTRKFDGKVYFGVHMRRRHLGDGSHDGPSRGMPRNCTIRVGDEVQVRKAPGGTKGSCIVDL